MATIPELLSLYKNGLLQLFFHRGEDGERRRLSLMKISILIIYIIAFVLAYFQFVETNISQTSIQNYNDNAIIPGNIATPFPLSIYGLLALLLNSILMIGVIYFIITQDRPLTTNRVKTAFLQIRDFITQNKIRIILVTILVIIIFLITRPRSSSDIELALYWTSRSAQLFWLLISPLLVYNAFLISIDVFAQDQPKLMKGFNPKLVVLFLCCFVTAIFIVVMTPIIFGVWLGTGFIFRADPIALEGFEGVFYFAFGLYGMLWGIVLISLITIFLIVYEIIISKKHGKKEIHERRKAILLLFFLFILIFVILQGIPMIFTFTLRLKALNNIIDLMGLLLMLFFAIFRVLGIQETQELPKTGRLNPRKWLKGIPPYSRALFILILAFTSFYLSLEANLILTLYGFQNLSRLMILMVNMIFGPFIYIYAYLRYQPMDSPELSKEFLENSAN